jgi:hypothetical protein
MNNKIVYSLKTINLLSPPQKDPDNPYYQLDLKCSGVNSGTFGSIGTVPTLRINTKGLVTFAGATTGIVIPPIITDFTIKGQNSIASPLYTSLENYNPDQEEVENISGFIGNYGRSLYSSNDLTYDKASGSMSIGSKSNSNNPINENNVAIGQRAMEDAYSKHCVAVGSYTVSKSINSNSITVGYGYPVGGNNLPSNTDNIMLGSGIYNSSGTKSIFISNHQNTLNMLGNRGSDSVSIGGYPNFGSTPGYSGILIGQTVTQQQYTIALYNSIFIGNALWAAPHNFILKDSIAILQSDTYPFSGFRGKTLESSVLIGNEVFPSSFYRDQIDGLNHVILGGGAGVLKPALVSADRPTACIAIGRDSTSSSNGISIGYKSGSFLPVRNDQIPGVPSLSATFSGGYGASLYGAGPPDSPPKNAPFGVLGKIVPDSEYVIGTTITSLAGGQTHSAALSNTGRLYMCGQNDKGQLGLGDTTTRYNYTFVPWSKSPGITIIKVFTYYNGTYVILQNSTLWGCGQINPVTNSSVFVLIDSGYSEISASRDYATGLTTWAGIKAGRLYTMGDNTYGQLGNGTTGGSTNTFALIGSFTFNKIQCGKSFIVAVRSDNRVMAWGKNNGGQLGLGNTTNYNTPQTVPQFIKWIIGGTPEYDTSSIVSISAGYECTAAVTANGNAYMTGKTADAFINGILTSYFKSLTYTRLELNIPIATPPYFLLPTQCLIINEVDVYFKMTDGSVCAMGRGDAGTFFAGDSPNNTFTGTPQALNPARFTQLVRLGTTSTFATGFAIGAHVLVPTVGGLGTSSNRICLAADGLVLPNTLIIGGSGGKPLGNPDGTGTERFANSGSASSLPSTPAAYLSIAINGTKYKLPLYNI